MGIKLHDINIIGNDNIIESNLDDFLNSKFILDQIEKILINQSN